MKEIKIESSNIKSIFYFENKNELYIFFKSNHLYVYKCNLQMYNKFLSSRDKDDFFLKSLKNGDFVKKILR